MLLGSGPLLPPYCRPSASIVNRPGDYGAGKCAQTPPHRPAAPAGAHPLPASLRFRLASFGPRYPSRRTCSSDATPVLEVVLRCSQDASDGNKICRHPIVPLNRGSTLDCPSIVFQNLPVRLGGNSR